MNRTVERILEALGQSPAEAVAEIRPGRTPRQFQQFYHRFNTSRDLVVFLWIIGSMRQRFGSLERAFSTGFSSEHEHVGIALESFVRACLETGFERHYPRGELRRRLGVRFLLPRPSSGSACKRMNLYLRWMVRPDDGIDCGVWQAVPRSHLVVPLDTHIARIASYIGLTEMKSPGWGMAEDITWSLRRLDRADPIRYDFALCHLGIARSCPRRRDFHKCAACPILAICRL